MIYDAGRVTLEGSVLHNNTAPNWDFEVASFCHQKPCYNCDAPPGCADNTSTFISTSAFNVNFQPQAYACPPDISKDGAGGAMYIDGGNVTVRVCSIIEGRLSATLFFGFNRHQPARAVGEDTSLVSAG